MFQNSIFLFQNGLAVRAEYIYNVIVMFSLWERGRNQGVIMYYPVIISIVCALINNVLLHALSKSDKKQNPYLFNMIVSFVWIICLIAINGGWHTSSRFTVLYGCLYGLSLAGFIFFKTRAMETGPIVLTSLIGCSGFIITTVFNAVYWKEAVGLTDISGIILMVVAIFLVTYQPKTDKSEQMRISLRWGIYCAFFFVFSAVIGIIFKMHQFADKENANEMMILASVVSFVLFLVLFLVGRLPCKNRQKTKDGGFRLFFSDKKTVMLSLSCGIVSCVYNRLNIYSSGVLPSTIFFPLFNGGVVIGSFIIGWVFFKEIPTKIRFIGAILGIIAVFTISRFFGLIG